MDKNSKKINNKNNSGIRLKWIKQSKKTKNNREIGLKWTKTVKKVISEKKTGQ